MVDAPLLGLTGSEALEHVTQMLNALIETYERLETQHGRTPSGNRRPSSEQTKEAAALVAEALASPALDRGNWENAVEDEDEPAASLHNRFWLKTVPKMPLNAYIARYDKYCRSSASTYLAAGRYIYEMSVVHRRMAITRNNVYRVFAAAFIVAAKIVEDILYPYKRYATTSGLSGSDLAKLEASFLFLCDFEFKVDRELLEDARDWPTGGVK